MATTFVACPSCGTQIHPIASRCKYCRCEVKPQFASVMMPASPALPEVAHAPRSTWTAVALGVIGAATLGLALYARLGADAEASPLVTEPSLSVSSSKQERLSKPDDAPPPALEPAKPSTGKWAALEGGWHGIGDQPDHGITWPVDIQFEKIGPVGSKVGVIKFGAPLGCSGFLERMADDGETLVLHETVTSDPDTRCVDEATLRLTRNGDKIDAVWIYTNGNQAATSSLTR